MRKLGNGNNNISIKDYNKLLTVVNSILNSPGAGTYVDSRGIHRRPTGSSGTIAVRWAKTQEAITSDGLLSVKFLSDNGTDITDPAFDVWLFWDRRTSAYTAADYYTQDGIALGSGVKVLIGQDQHGDWYLLQPTLILACAAE